jgi:hypothetical protein
MPLPMRLITPCYCLFSWNRTQPDQWLGPDPFAPRAGAREADPGGGVG